ncbi:MAG: GNAT family N-acetyltransferase, partial [Paracoccaceae bacterium]
APSPVGSSLAVGVYRLMREAQAADCGRFYSADEYDLTPLTGSGRRLLELGRSCVDRAHRGGTAMLLLWNALSDYVLKHRIELMFGVASYHGVDPEPIAQSLSYLHHFHPAPADCRVAVRPGSAQRLDLISRDLVDRKTAMLQTPALIKAYLRLGGFIGEGAYVDHEFNTLDVCVVMDTIRMSERHRTAYSRRSAARA